MPGNFREKKFYTILAGFDCDSGDLQIFRQKVPGPDIRLITDMQKKLCQIPFPNLLSVSRQHLNIFYKMDQGQEKQVQVKW